MGTLYVDTGGAATNSGSTDQNAANLSGAAATVSGSVVTLDGSPDLSGLITAAGPTQSSIYIDDATNSNRKIFWITAFDNTAKTVTVDTAPTGVTSSDWAIGGRIVWTPANVEAGLRPDDTVIFNNSPAARTSAFYTHRVAGTGAGYIRLKGKVGVRPVFNVTNTAVVINGNNTDGLWLENLEFDQDGASGNVLDALGTTVVLNCKIVDGGGIGVVFIAGGLLSGCEITGVLGDGLNATSTTLAPLIFGNYIHDVGGDAIELVANNLSTVIQRNIIDTAAGRGVYLSSSGSTTGLGRTIVDGNTIYGCGNSGFEVTDADTAILQFTNNIFSENGNAAGEYNVEFVAGSIETKGFHANNVFFHSGGGGGSNLLGLTANSTEVTTDPLFTDPANGDFTLQTSSPAKAAGFIGTFLGGPVSYTDIGAVQRQEPASSVTAHVIGE